MSQPKMPEYKGAPLDADRGPGLGCFWIQVVLLVVLLVLTPLSVAWAWPSMVSAALLILSLVILFFVGMTIVFLLRLTAADRRSRRRPLGPSARRTIGEIEDAVRIANSVGEIGDKVVIADTDATRAAGFAGRRGTATAWSTPSVSSGAVIGQASVPKALGVEFEDGTTAWFDPDLAIPAKRLMSLTQDDSLHEDDARTD